MSNRQILALTLATAMELSTNTIVYANNTTESAEENREVNVTSVQDSSYSVKIPKKIVMSGSKKQATYEVTASGDIAGYESLIVEPVEDLIEMESTGKNTVTMSIAQDKKSWSYTDLNTVGNGIIQETLGGGCNNSRLLVWNI